MGWKFSTILFSILFSNINRVKAKAHITIAHHFLDSMASDTMLSTIRSFICQCVFVWTVKYVQLNEVVVADAVDTLQLNFWRKFSKGPSRILNNNIGSIVEIWLVLKLTTDGYKYTNVMRNKHPHNGRQKKYNIERHKHSKTGFKTHIWCVGSSAKNHCNRVG